MSPQQQQQQQQCYLWVQGCRRRAAETQPRTLEMWAFGKAAAVGSEVASGEAGRRVASVVATGTVWGFASFGAAVSAGGVGTADRSSAGGGETDEGVNFAASVALEPCAFAAVVPESAGWTGFLHLCTGKGLPRVSWQGLGVPGGSVEPLETNLVEPPQSAGSSLPTPAPAESA